MGPRIPGCIRLRSLWRDVRNHLPPMNFITIHYLYFLGTCLAASLIFWGASTPFGSVSYTDSLYLTISAMTLAGLNTINLSTLNAFQQFILFFLIILGSAILVSIVVMHVRKTAFERKFRRIVEDIRHKRSDGTPMRQRTMSFTRSPTFQRPTSKEIQRGPVPNGSRAEDFNEKSDGPAGERRASETLDDSQPRGLPVRRSEANEAEGDAQSPDSHHIVFGPETQFRSQLDKSTQPPQRRHLHLLSMQGVGAYSNAISPRRAHKSGLRLQGSQSRDSGINRVDEGPYIGRNSQFHGLTLVEREELGGVEYRAIQVLSIIVPLYYFLWLLLGSLGLGAWIAHHKTSTARENGINPWWLGAFNAISAFNNSGLSLLDANMIPFQDSIYVLITMGLMILAGNTCYPIFLRLIIWTLKELLPARPEFEQHNETFQFLLDHPRRCYTNLFPSRHTFWLLSSVIVLNGIDWVAFEVLNIGNPAVTSLPRGSRALDGLFQALAVRSGGFYIINITSLRIGLQVLYVLMMYISVYPVVITMRNSNVYEERSLGLYADDLTTPTEESPEKESYAAVLRRRFTGQSGKAPAGPSSSYFVSQQLRAQLAHDLWWIVLAVLFITIIETGQFEGDPVTYSVFNVIFEVVSAYGCVGISTGLPNEAYSFSGGWHKLSKLILCGVMIRGRHRGLPVAIDRAVLLPGEHLAAAEEQDAMIHIDRMRSHVVDA